ncbi:hypothetical protein ACET3Z_031126 [Daucus carota]
MPPSPPIPRSISAPDVFVSNRSASSGQGTSWLKKTSSLLTYTKKESELTEQSLEALNKRNEALEDKKASHSSPYYKGLTDFTLDINKEKLPSASSPAVDNHEAISFTSSTRSSFIVTMQQLGTFCLFFRSKDEKESSSSASTLSSKQQKDIDSDKGKKEDKSSLVESKSNYILSKEMPMRERVSVITYEPPALQISPPRYKPMIGKSVLPETRSATKASLNEEELSGSVERTYVFTWADKYRPHNLTEFICNREKAMELKAMANSQDISHFIFEGLPGVGKRTMILALLRETFGADKIKARDECMEFYLKGEALSSIEVNVKRSSHHVELNISDLKGYEKHVIVKLINEKCNKSSDSVLESVIVLHEADKLSSDALLYLRWVLEKYKGYNKVFFCCNEVSKLQPIKTLCRVIKLLPPSNEEIMEVLDFIAKEEGIELASKVAETITDNSKNNLRQAIRSFEATWRYNATSQLTEDQEIMTGWEDTIAKVARDIVKEQSPRQLFIIRGELQKLIEYNVSPVFIFKTLVGELKRHLDESSQTHVDILFMEAKKREGIDCAAFIHSPTEEMCKRKNDPSRKNVHNFMKIEEFIAKFMSWYKVLLTNTKLQDVKMKGILDDLDPTKGVAIK